MAKPILSRRRLHHPPNAAMPSASVTSTLFQVMFGLLSWICDASRLNAVTWCPRLRASLTTRLPMVPVSDGLRKKLEGMLAELGLLTAASVGGVR